MDDQLNEKQQNETPAHVHANETAEIKEPNSTEVETENAAGAENGDEDGDDDCVTV